MNLNCRFGLLLIMTLSAISPLSAQRPVDPTRPLFSPPEPSISCGMTIFPGRHSVDPGMPKDSTSRKLHPADAKTRSLP